MAWNSGDRVERMGKIVTILVCYIEDERKVFGRLVAATLMRYKNC